MRIKSTYPASRVFFDLPRQIGKRKETLRAASRFFDPPLIRENGWVSPVDLLVKPVFHRRAWSFVCRVFRSQSLLPLPDLSRKIEGDSARRVSIYLKNKFLFKSFAAFRASLMYGKAADWHMLLRPSSDAVLHISRIECKWEKSFVLPH